MGTVSLSSRVLAFLEKYNDENSFQGGQAVGVQAPNTETLKMNRPEGGSGNQDPCIKKKTKKRDEGGSGGGAHAFSQQTAAAAAAAR